MPEAHVRTLRTNKQAGFTLLELLVVVFIAGIMAGLTVMTIGGNTEREFKRDVARIQQVMNLAADEAQFNGQELGLWLSPDGKSYSFYTFDEQEVEWVPYDKHGFTDYPLPVAYRMQLEILGKPIDLAELYKEIFKLDDKISSYGEKPIAPLLIFFSDGDYTPFHLWLTNPYVKEFVYVLEGDGLGAIRSKLVEARAMPELPDDK